VAPKKTQASSQAERWLAFEAELRRWVPHAAAWLSSVEEFRELRFKARDDGTVLAIAKGYGSDGGPTVCFGVGYDVITAFMQLDKTVQGGHWKFDKPWAPDI